MTTDNFFIPDELHIKGGRPIHGSIDISGAKNSILGLMCAALLTDEKVVLHNVPNISDVLEMGHIMRDLGVDVSFDPEQKLLCIHAKKLTKNILSAKAVKFRASYYLWGSLLARFKRSGEFNSLKVRLPGGCGLGEKRKTDFHEELMKNIFGADIHERQIEGHCYLSIDLPAKRPNNSNPIYTTAKVSHGATFHWLLSIAGSNSLKMMYNSSLEPEVSNLIDMLSKMGLGIRGTERTGLIYDGSNRKLLKGGDFYCIPDRLEAAAYAMLALGTKGQIRIRGINYEHCSPWLLQLGETGAGEIYFSEDRSEIVLNFADRKPFKGSILQMSPFPGMETDLQQIWTPILGLAETTSTIVDIIWPGRYYHLDQMRHFGLESSYKHVEVDAGQGISYKALIAKIEPSQLHAGTGTGEDLRGTTGLILLAAMVEGSSTILKPEYALRGYPYFIKNLQSLGVDIKPSKTGANLDPLPFYKA